nr:hypothetical protein [uncultured Rhodopila sp.]
MLALAEQFLLARLARDPALQSDPKPVLFAGGAAPPTDRSSPALALWLRGMRVPPPEPDATEAARSDTARLVRHLTLDPDPTGRAFRIPPDSFYEKVDQLAEVWADGRQLRAGGDYQLDDLTIRCLRPPGGPLTVRILGDTVSGYTERRAAVIRLVLRGWGPSSGTPDQQGVAAGKALTRGVAALLVAMAGRDVADLAADEEAGLEMRLLKPRALLCSVARFPQRSDATDAPSAEAVLTISGELELTLTRGSAPEPLGTIERVEVDAPSGVAVQ